MLKAKHVSESRSCDRYHFKPLAPGDLWVDPGLSSPVRPSSHPTNLGLDDFFWEPRSLGWNMSVVYGEDLRKNAKKKMFFGLWSSKIAQVSQATSYMTHMCIPYDRGRFG